MGLSAAQLANQARLRARAAVSKYYDGALVSDDELHPLTTRNVCLRTQVRPILVLSDELHTPVLTHNVCLNIHLSAQLPFPVAEHTSGFNAAWQDFQQMI